MRLFNTYGNSSDEFSLIENVIKAKKSNKRIKLINNGNSVRDFIHVKDVAKIYKIIIDKKFKSGIYDLGTGEGYLIKDVIDYLNFSKSKIVKVNNIDEIHNSIAQNKDLIKALNDYKFLKLSKYLHQKIKTNKRSIRPTLNHAKETRKGILKGIVIYGVGYAGKRLYHELKKNNEDILFFIDDDLKKQNTNYKGIPIISYKNLLEIRKTYKIQTVYLKQNPTPFFR